MFKTNLRATPSSRRNAVALAAATLIALYAQPMVVQAQSVQLPQGGAYQRGAGSITTNGNSAQINTTSAPGKVAVINWGGGFNVGAGGQVNFNNATGANSLNAINVDPTGKTSSINGALNGTGPGMNILVVNPNGVTLGSGARINTTGSFSAVAGNLDPASVQSGEAGTVSIVLGNAPVVVHSAVAGQSSAPGLLEVGPSKAISMRADAAATLPAVLGSADMSITGPGAVTGSGNVAGAGESYKLNTAGSLTFTNASVAATNSIAITGKEVGLAATSVNASAGGASVKIGGGARGKDTSITNAQVTNVDASSSITTGANSSVVVWGDKANFEGTIVNPGGNAEISGKQLAYSGKTDLRGQGKTGTLLFDPDDLVIDAAGGAYTAQGFGTTGTSTITGAAISSAMQTASVALEANNSITVQDAITSTTAGSNLSMSTGGLLAIGAPINIQGNFEGKVGALGAVAPTATPEIRMNPGAIVATNGGNIKLWNEGTALSSITAGGSGIVNGVQYQGTSLDASGGNVEVTVGSIFVTGMDIKTTGTGKIDVQANQGGFNVGYAQPSVVPGVVNIGEGGVWSTERGDLNLSSSAGSGLQGVTLKTYAGSGQTGGNISVYSGNALYGSAVGNKPLQILAVGATDAVKTGDIAYASSPFTSSYTYGATIYSGPQNDPNGSAQALSVQPGSITLGPGGYAGNNSRFYDTQISNRVSWGTNDKSAPISINGFSLFSLPSGGATAFGPEPTNGGFFAEGNWYAAGAVPGLGKPATIMSSRPENYSYTPLVSSGDMALTNVQYGAVNGADAGGKLDMTYNPIFVASAGVDWRNLKSGGDMTLAVGNQPNTTLGWADSGGKLSITGWSGVKIDSEMTAAKGVSLWNQDTTGSAAYAFRFLTGAKITSTATSGESMALAAFNFATGFDFGGQPLPLIAPGGRWAYYFTDPSGISADPLFGPTQSFHRYNCTYGGAAGACVNTDAPAIPTSGTAYLYAHAPVLTVTNPTMATTYGTAPDYTAAKTVSGYLSADAGIDAVTGTMAVSGGTYSTSGNLQAGAQAVTYSGGLASELGYKFAGPQFTVNVAQKQIAMTGGITGVNKEYDGAATASVNTSGAYFTGAATGDVLTASATGSFADKNAGNNKAVALSGLAIGGTDSANYILAPAGNQNTAYANITKKTVTVDSGLTLDDKVYDGTTQATANSSAGVISGVLAADVGSVTVGVVAGNYADKHVGSNKVATLSSFDLAGTEGGNYVVDAAASQSSATGNVTQKTITIASVGNADKVYDATAAASGVAVLNGVISGDSVTGAATGTFADKNVGTNKTVTYTNFTLGDTEALNYVVAGSGNATAGTASISAKSITIDSGLSVGKVYDGSAAVVANGTAAVISGVLGTDVVAANATGAFIDKNAGVGKTATFTSFGLSGQDANNYVVNAAGSQTSAVGDITPRSVTVTSGFTADKVYDGTTAAVINGSAVVIAGKVVGDDLGATASGAFLDKNAGTNKTVNLSGLAVSGTDAANYTLNTAASQSTILATITPKTIQIASGLTADKTYDGSTAATINSSAAVMAGKVIGDDLGATATGAFVDKNAGVGKTVNVTGYGVTGSDAGNYVLGSGNQATIAATIAPKAVTIGGGSIAGVDKVYDGTTAAQIAVSGATVAGQVSGDALVVNANGTFDTKNVGVDKTVTFGGYGLSGTDANNYTVTGSTPPAPATTASITPRSVNVTGVLIGDKTFDGTTSTSGNAAGASVTGFLPGDSVGVNSGSVSVNFVDPSVGTGKAVSYQGSNLLTGADAGNYLAVQVPVPGAPATGSIFAAGPVVPPVVTPPVIAPPLVPAPITLPPEALPRTTTQGSVFGGWVVDSSTGGVQTTSPELGTAGSISMSSGALSTTGGGATRTEVCISQAVAMGQKASDAIKQCSVVSVPKSTR